MTVESGGRLSQWRDTAGIDAGRAGELASRLERRAEAADEGSARRDYLDRLGIAAGERVLDVGCGSGVVTRDIARRVAPGGVAVGLDPSPAFLAIARERVNAAGLGALVEFRQGDARALPFGDGEFDVALAATVLAHVPEGERAIPEMARVVREGGRVGIFDFDGDSIIISHPDRALTRRIVIAASDHAAVNGWLARQLPGLLVAAGLRNVQVRAFMPLERDPSGFYATMAKRAAEVAAEAGEITDAERCRWLGELQAELDGGRFVGGRAHLFVWGTR